MVKVLSNFYFIISRESEGMERNGVTECPAVEPGSYKPASGKATYGSGKD